MIVSQAGLTRGNNEEEGHGLARVWYVSLDLSMSTLSPWRQNRAASSPSFPKTPSKTDHLLLHLHHGFNFQELRAVRERHFRSFLTCNVNDWCLTQRSVDEKMNVFCTVLQGFLTSNIHTPRGMGAKWKGYGSQTKGLWEPNEWDVGAKQRAMGTKWKGYGIGFLNNVLKNC